MNINKRQRFIMWLVLSIFLGALPWLINFIIHFVAQNVNIYSILQVDDLMFFVIMFSAITILDLILHKPKKELLIPLGIALIVIIIIAAVFLGISAFYTAIPHTSGLFLPIQLRLIWCSFAFCILSFLANLSIQIYICFFPDRKLSKKNK